jgi:hypothetical protein
MVAMSGINGGELSQRTPNQRRVLAALESLGGPASSEAVAATLGRKTNVEVGGVKLTLASLSRLGLVRFGDDGWLMCEEARAFSMEKIAFLVLRQMYSRLGDSRGLRYLELEEDRLTRSGII